MKRIGIDLGGTKIESMLTNIDPLDVLERKRVPTPKAEGYECIVQTLEGLIRELLDQCGSEHVTIGIGLPGSISEITGLIHGCNILCLNGTPLKHDLSKRLGRDLRIENDANCFALSETKLGAGRWHNSIAGVILGTGGGGGIVIDGKLWNGLHGNAGEWGHSCLDINGPECWCGARGCMELYLSGTGLQRMYREAGGSDKKVPAIYQDYKEREELAVKVINEFLRYFGRGMANIINTFDPDVLILGGGVSNLPILYEEGVEEVRKQTFSYQGPTPIVQNQLGDSSGIYGAALLGI